MRVCIDLDGTICETKRVGQSYEDVLPNPGVVEALNLLAQSHYVIIYTARNMVTHSGNLGKINKHQARITMDWLDKYNIPYDEILFGKPHYDVFIDDKAMKFTSWEQTMKELNNVNL